MRPEILEWTKARFSRQSTVEPRGIAVKASRLSILHRLLILRYATIVLLLLIGCSGADQFIAYAVPNSQYWTKAQDTHNFVVGNLLTSYNSYRIHAGSTTSYTWYNASQIDADAAMLTEGDTRYAPYMNNTYSWMNNVWDIHSSIGGYFAAANVNGTGAGGAKYVDDNSLTGIAYLDAYAVTTGTQQAAYLASAEAIANYLMNSGLWDTNLGGGFWWSTDKTVKPTQSNGLALQLFLRLYQITGKSYYSQWATSIKSWLETKMLNGNNNNGLYIWEIKSDGTVQTTNFTYDNSIMIEADLLWASIMKDISYVTKAESIANALNTVLWDSTHKVYKFNTGDSRVNPTWCVWASEALVRLYQADLNTSWLDYAQQNIDFMNTYLRNTTNYGYYQWCNNDGTNRSTDQEEVDQAWMERTQALLALYR